MILFFNGHIGYLSGQQKVTAMAVENDRIVAVGKDEDILTFSRPGVEIVNLEGKTILPGLMDSHLHMEMYAKNLNLIDCEVPTKDECLKKIAQKAAILKSDSWLLGHGWNQNVWQGQFGTASELDSVTADHPTFLSDKSLHSAWVNSLALKLAGIDRETPDPPGGIIQRDKNGFPTGILFETAVALVEQIISAPSQIERENQFLTAQQKLHQMGLTGIHDFDGLSSYETIQSLHEQKKLTLRVVKSIPLEKLDWAIEQGIQTGQGDEQFHWGSVKLFADGALGPQTAAMWRPYEESPFNRGKLQLTEDDVFEVGIKAVTHGLSLAVHAIGDRATHEVLNGFGMLREYEKRHSIPHLQHRIEHLQLLHPDNLLKASQLEIIASMQPIHATSDMLTADRYWGDRSRFAYAFNTLLANQTKLVFGSDAPVENPNPFWGIHAAVTRRRHDGSPCVDGWFPEERITLPQAFDAYTQWAARLSGFLTGELIPGKFADFIIIKENLDTINLQELFTICPERCMIAGKWVY